ncbi:MAG: hypothetical protein QXZ25_06125 [Candidatus Bathyarchaeia archaeon]
MPIFVGFIVGRKERIEKKLGAYSRLVEDFDSKLENARAKGIWLCTQCFRDNVIELNDPRQRVGFLRTFKCQDCGHIFKDGDLPQDLGIEANAKIVNQIIRLSVRGLKNVKDIHDEVVETAYDYGFNLDIGRTTIYDIRRKIARLLKWFDRFIIVGLLEGISCERLEVDEIFQSRLHRRMLQKYLEGMDGGKPRFYYLINAISQRNRYPLPSDVAEARNKNAFLNFVLKIGVYLRADPITVNSDELKPLTGALELRFPRSNIDTTKRTKHGKIGMEKVAHVERLNRTYRKAIPKHKKLGKRSIINDLAVLVRVLKTYLWKHETLNKRVIEVLGVPFPKSIRTPSDLILFASFIKQKSNAILGDEYEIFESPLLGRCVFTIQFEPATFFHLIGRCVAEGHYLVLILNAWVPAEERKKIVESFLKSRELVVELPLRFNIYKVEIIHEKEKNLIHIVGDIPAGVYTIVLPIWKANEPSILYFDTVWVDPGKVNHFLFRFNSEDFIRQFTVAFVEKLVDPDGKIYGNVFLAPRMNHEGEISCPKEVHVPKQEQVETIAPYINELKEIADEYDATHIVGLAVWAANESLTRTPRPHTIDVNPNNRNWLLAAFYVVLRELVTNIKFEEYAKVLEKKGINPTPIFELKEKIRLKNIEMLERRLMQTKTYLGNAFARHHENLVKTISAANN